MTDSQPVLYIVAGGGPPAADLAGFVDSVQQQGWDACVITTPDGARFLDAAELARLTGHPVRDRYKDPGDPDVLPAADVFVVAPATFNTVNKLACGISDTLALGLLNEAVGLGLPVIAVPWPNTALARHPAFRRSLAALREWGITVIFDPDRLPPVAGTSPPFPWPQLQAELARAYAAIAYPD